MRKNFALIGCGEVAKKYHVDAIKSVGGTILYGCDPNAQAFEDVVLSKNREAAWFTNYKDVLGMDNIDFVSICTPNYLHVQMALDALDAGKKVILEKPVGIDIESVNKLINHPRSKDVAICYQRRFSEQALEIKRDNHKPTEIKAMVFVRRDPAYWNEWRTDVSKSGGANLINIDVHYLDLIQWWLGPSYKLKFAKVAQRMGIDQVTYAHFDFNGTDVKFLGSSIHDDREINIEVHYASGHKLLYTEDTGLHNQVYQAFLAGDTYVTPKEAAISLQMALDIYKYDKENP